MPSTVIGTTLVTPLADENDTELDELSEEELDEELSEVELDEEDASLERAGTSGGELEEPPQEASKANAETTASTLIF
ncbi:MAG TPA: hypothetical protein VIC08_01800 [Cellvibrionaceae bacterium]